MKVSIVIPVYNVSDYIEECLLSALNQTYEELEILLVDDASPDESMAKARKIVDAHPCKDKVHFLSHDENRGLSAARNTGIRNSIGEFLFFLDSDDMLPSDAIEILVKAMNGIYADFVIGEYELLGSNDRLKYPETELMDGTCLADQDIADKLFARLWHGMAWNKLVRRRMFTEQSCWFYEGILHEDILWSFCLAARASELLVAKKITYKYRVRPGSITQKMSDRNFDSLEIVFREIVKEMKNRNMPLTPLLFDYLANQRIYFFKELLRNHVKTSVIRERIQRVNQIFKGYNSFSWRKYPFMSNLKLLAYKLPVRLACLYVKATL